MDGYSQGCPFQNIEFHGTGYVFRIRFNCEEKLCNMSVVRTACLSTGVFFHVFLKFKRGMLAVSSMTTPLRAYMFRIDSAVILVLAVNSSKMEQIDFFILQ